ncbi:MAG: hypothetical protein LUG54_06675 [Clostridiales bacterium]|nr:hypothetical protein [Clostridiales bacterium]
MNNLFDLKEDGDVSSGDGQSLLLPQLNDYMDNSKRLEQMFFSMKRVCAR